MFKANERKAAQHQTKGGEQGGGVDGKQKKKPRRISDQPHTPPPQPLFTKDGDWLSESLKQNILGAADAKVTEPNSAFTVVTWNIWFSPYEWQARLAAALVETLQQDPDVFCFQEVRTEVHQCMLQCEFLRERYSPTEEQLLHGYDCAVWTKKGRLSICSTTTIPLKTIYGRRGVSVDIELTIPNSEDQTPMKESMRRIRIATVHLESGREMKTTRESQLKTLFAYIQKAPFKRNAHDDESAEVHVAFLVGDFNLDPSYLENQLVDSNGIDLWKAMRSADDAGFTENTYQNNMRYLAHGKHKQVRYDRIIMIRPAKVGLSKSPDPDNSSSSSSSCHTDVCAPKGIELLGTIPFDREGKVWVSDHFGLVAKVSLSSLSGGSSNSRG